MPTAQITNISSYQFATLTDLKPLREELLSFCKSRSLRGTILLSTEGINLFIAGEDQSVKALLDKIRQISGLESLQAKFSYSGEQPFRRMLVRIKKEIITFGIDGIQPAQRTSPKLKAAELKQWLDEGRPITLLDTRNDYEVKLGTFHGAQILPISHFRQFPDAVRALPEELKQQPIVMFCTGGIRCEKAGPFMEREGFQNIYQLDGGILRYFEEVGSAHYDGECFVFDQRTGVDPALAETGSSQCYACQTPLTAEEQADPRYVENISCPYCFKSSEEQLRLALEARQQKLHTVCTPLPGSVPHDLRRPLHVPATCDKMTVLDTLTTVMPQVGREEWLRVIEVGRILRRTDDAVLSAKDILRAGEQILHFQPEQLEPEVNADIQLLYEDQAIIVLQKPAPLPIHPGGRFTLNTLTHLIQLAYAPERPRPAHRLDSDTTGLMVLSRTRHFAGILQPQFSRGEVEKVYLLRVHGHPSWETQRCEAQISQQKAIRAVDDEGGDDALTEFKVLLRNADSTLLEARPLTGRTNQIRLHAWHLGHPIVGDPVYLQARQLAEAKGLTSGGEPLCLHAWKLSFKHPLTRKLVSFETELPVWAY